MCGPLISLSGIFKADRSTTFYSFFQYHLGRISMYALLGAILGWIGHVTEFIIVVKYMTLGLSALIILFSIMALYGKKFSTDVKIVSASIRLYNAILKSKLPFKTFLLGSLNGIVPCGLVYSAMVFSFMNNEIYYGSMSMVLFGLGTLPILLMSVYGVTFIKYRNPVVLAKLQYAGLLISGCFLLYKSLLLNIDPNTNLWSNLINQNMCAH